MTRRFGARGIAAAAVMGAAMLSGLSAQAAATPAEVQALVGRYGCMACHGMVHKQVGPGFAQVAERYRDDAVAPARLAGKIRNGSVGEWGRVIMPRQPNMTEAESRLLAGWVLSQPVPAH
ncbi:MAG: c-type cytochrome [Janthinobacterium lividum]